MSISLLVITYFIIGTLFSLREIKRKPVQETVLVKVLGGTFITVMWLPIIIFQALT